MIAQSSFVDFVANYKKCSCGHLHTESTKTCALCKERNKKWYNENRERVLKYNKKRYNENPEYHKKWYNENPERISKHRKKWNNENRERISKYNKKRYNENRERISKYNKNTYNRVRHKIIAHYTNNHFNCDGCNIIDPACNIFRIHHFYLDGKEHRERVNDWYYDIIKNNFPPRFLILCGNCHPLVHKYGIRQFKTYIPFIHPRTVTEI